MSPTSVNFTNEGEAMDDLCYIAMHEYVLHWLYCYLPRAETVSANAHFSRPGMHPQRALSLGINFKRCGGLPHQYQEEHMADKLIILTPLCVTVNSPLGFDDQRREAAHCAPAGASEGG